MTRIFIGNVVGRLIILVALAVVIKLVLNSDIDVGANEVIQG
jgi:hypothetical protein